MRRPRGRQSWKLQQCQGRGSMLQKHDLDPACLQTHEMAQRKAKLRAAAVQRQCAAET